MRQTPKPQPEPSRSRILYSLIFTLLLVLISFGEVRGGSPQKRAAQLSAQASTTSESRGLDIFWTDRGINNYESGQTVGSMIKGQTPILLPMPGDANMPKTQAQWDSFGKSMEGFFRAKLTQALARGVTQIEILTQQNIKMGGYSLSPQRQAYVTEYTRQIGKALLSVKEGLTSDGVHLTIRQCVAQEFESFKLVGVSRFGKLLPATGGQGAYK